MIMMMMMKMKMKMKMKVMMMMMVMMMMVVVVAVVALGEKQFLAYVFWIMKRASLPMLQATNVFSCSAPRSKQQEKTRSRTQRNTLCEPTRVQNEPRTRTAQNAGIHFVQACAVETHVKISQEPLDTEIYR